MKPGVALLTSWQPESLSDSGVLLRHRGQQVEEAGSDVESAFRTLAGSWSGLSADAAQGAGSARGAQLADLAELMNLAGGVLLRAGDDLAREKATLTRLLADARNRGCTVADDGTVSPPPMPTMPYALSEDEAETWTENAQAQADSDADAAAALTTELKACLTAAGEIDDAAAAALGSANASATLTGGPGGGVELGGLDDYQPMNGITAPQALLHDFDRLDPDGDGKIDREDLEAAVGDESLPIDLRAAAQYLLDNPTLYDHAEAASSDYTADTDGTLSRDDLQTFTAMQPQLAVLARNFDVLDTAHEGGDGDDYVSQDDLEAVAASTTLPLALRNAARWFLDHPDQLRAVGTTQPSTWGDGKGFRYDDLVSRAVDDQVFTDDPAAAADFVRSLPFPGPGETGLKVGLVSDDGFASLANASLIDAGADLTETNAIISHLPETDSGMRNHLITSSYVDLSTRMDELLAGDLAGLPQVDGHPGANWMIFAPWASNGVHDAITGEFSVFGVHPMEAQRQAAADGNQWIYGDIGSRYASFLEFYADHPNPTPEQLQTYFADNYGEGDAQIQSGMAAYSELMTTDDPARRQELAYQANVLIAVHEQSGAQPWLEDIASPGPDELYTEYIDIRMGDQTIDVNQDIEPPAGAEINNHVLEREFLDLDPGDRSASEIAPTALGGLDLPTISGEEAIDDEFPTTLAQMADGGSDYTRVTTRQYGYTTGVHFEDVNADPDSLTATGATSWPNRDERMYMLSHLFEQQHTNPQLWQASEDLGVSYDTLDWLDPRTGLVP